MKKTYKIYRILNNNAVVSRDEKGQEIIIVGMGIGFHTRTGYYVEPEKVSSVYILQGKENCSRFRALINEIPFDCIEISGKIIDEAKKLLMNTRNMTEEEAHRFIQKSSMDSGTNMVETAQMVLQIMH